MACIRGMYSSRGEDGDCQFYHSQIFYIYILSHDGFSRDHIPVCGLLDEC